jgi:hypothetical protein
MSEGFKEKRRRNREIVQYKRNKLKKLTENKGENKLRRKLRGKNIYKPRKRNEEQ